MPSQAIRPSNRRLELIAATLDHVQAELDGPERLALLLNARVAPGWPPGEYDREAQEFFQSRLKQGGCRAIGWYTWYAVLRQNPDPCRVLVGAGGYFGPPNHEGEVEIGFSIMPAWRGLGYATEMAGMLLQNAFRDHRVTKVVARTEPKNLASGRVLKKCGLGLVAPNGDPGLHYYEISRKTWALSNSGSYR